MHFPSSIFLLPLVLILVTACDKDPIPDPDPMDMINTTAPNILLIIADDMGKDATNGYPEGLSKPTTPHIDQFKNEGITFNNCWVNPTCTPTRSSIISGKYGFRTGVTEVGDQLQESETILQKYISQESEIDYATAIVGKWHLGAGMNSPTPESFGLDHYAGLISGAVTDYYDWSYYNDGVTTNETAYATKKITDDAIQWVNMQSKPWFLWLAYNAPHTPFHAPPSEMHAQGNLAPYQAGDDALPYFLAAIEAMDYQIGRLLDNLSESEKANTIILFVGDNGSPGQVAQFPYDNMHAKGSLYQGGVNTPFFVSGKTVTRIGETDNSLINGTDLFATIASIAGVEVNQINDSQNFSSLFDGTTSSRSYQYSEKIDGTDELWTIGNGAYKLVINNSGAQEMYDLNADPYESNNLLTGNLNAQQTAAKTSLETASASIRN